MDPSYTVTNTQHCSMWVFAVPSDKKAQAEIVLGSSRSIQRGKAETQNMSKIGLKTEAGEVKSYGMIEYCASIFDKTNGQNTRNMIGTAAKADTCVPQSCEALG